MDKTLATLLEDLRAHGPYMSLAQAHAVERLVVYAEHRDQTLRRVRRMMDEAGDGGWRYVYLPGLRKIMIGVGW